MNQHILLAYRLDGRGGAVALEGGHNVCSRHQKKVRQHGYISMLSTNKLENAWKEKLPILIRGGLV